MKLAEALLLQPELVKKIENLRRERVNSAYRKFNEDDKDHPTLEPERSVDEITTEINVLSEAVRKLSLYTSHANSTNTIPWKMDDGSEEMFLSEAVMLLDQMRKGQSWLQDLGNKRTTTQVINPLGGYGSIMSNSMTRSKGVEANGPKDWTYKEISEPTFDTKKYKAMAEQNEKAIRKLEALISQKDWEIEIPFEFEG